MENYQIAGSLGEGAHGQVVKAKHLPTGQWVALKQLPLHPQTEYLLERDFTLEREPGGLDIMEPPQSQPLDSPGVTTRRKSSQGIAEEEEEGGGGGGGGGDSSPVAAARRSSHLSPYLEQQPPWLTAAPPGGAGALAPHHLAPHGMQPLSVYREIRILQQLHHPNVGIICVCVCACVRVCVCVRVCETFILISAPLIPKDHPLDGRDHSRSLADTGL